MSTEENRSDLLERWQALMAAEPALRARNAAQRLGVSEGELLAARCGQGVTRLKASWKPLLLSLVRVGQVLVITRNEFAVSEKRGYYSNLELREHGGGAFDYNINLRYFFRHWAHGFAVSEAGPGGATRRSLQFFDRDGSSVHKIYQTDNGDEAAWDRVVDEFTAGDQSRGMGVEPASAAYVPQSPEGVDPGSVRQQWRAMTDIHQFWTILVEHRLRRIDALRMAGHELARPVAPDAWRTVLESVARSGLDIMVFTASPGVSQIHTGPIHRTVERDGWFNILDPNFNLHLRGEAVSEAWVVWKPTGSGGQTSLELYHENGQLVSHLFGAVNLSAPEMRGWRRLLAELPTIPAEVHSVA